MNQTTRTGWKTIHSALGSSLARPDLEDPQSVDWFNFQWKLIVGKDLMSITQVKKLSAKTLFVAVSDKIWFPALKALHRKIIIEINQRAESIVVNRIVFQEDLTINTVIKNNSVGEKQRPLLPKKDGEAAFGTDDDSLRDIIDRISNKIQAVSLAGMLLFISNCTTLPTDKSSRAIDLSDSYAVRTVEKLAKKKTGDIVRDPRAYYHYLMALKAVRVHHFKKAAKNFSEMVQFDPSYFQIHHQLAINLIRSGEVNAAYKVLEESLRYFPDNPELNMMIGDILDGRKEYERALTHYRNVIKAQPGSARAYLLSGSIYEHLKQYNLAADMYRQTIQVESGNPLGHHYLARMNILSGDLQDAEKHLSQALELRPSLLQSREFLAWTWEKQGNKDDALREYKILFKLDPSNKIIEERMDAIRDLITPMDIGTPEYQSAAEKLLGKPEVHMKIGSVYYEQAIYLKALDEFQLVRAQGEQTQKVLMVLGRVYEILGRLDRAIAEINILVGKEPQLVSLMIYSARLYSLNGQPEETIRLISEAIKIEEGNDILHHSLALAYISVSQFDQAIKSMRKAISINKNKDSYYFELGALLERTGELELAMQNIKRSIELNPMHSNAHNFLGYMYAIQGKSLDKALGHLHKALSIQPKNGYFLDSLSWIYFKKGEPQRALDELKKAMVYASPDPVLYSHLGDIHFSLENYFKAGNAWKTSLLLTLEKKDNSNGELPDPKDLKKKIREVRELLDKK